MIIEELKSEAIASEPGGVRAESEKKARHIFDAEPWR